MSHFPDSAPSTRLTGRIAALDVGEARIGVALSDPSGLLASPHSIFDRRKGGGIAALAAMIRKAEARAVVVGLPLDQNGREGPQAQKVREFAEKLRQALFTQAQPMAAEPTATPAPGIPVLFFDERLTTRLAQQSRIDSGMGKKKRRTTHDDAAAAAILLQNWLDRERHRAG